MTSTTFTPSEQERYEFGAYTSAGLRNWFATHNRIPAGRAVWFNQLADALDATGYQRLSDTPSGWCWTAVQHITATTQHPPEPTETRTVTDEQRAEFGRVAIIDLRAWATQHPDADGAVVEWTRELADALDSGPYLYLHETPPGWGWTVTRRDGGTVVLHETVALPAWWHEHDKFRNWSAKYLLDHADHANSETHTPLNRLARLGLGGAMTTSGYAAVADVPERWQYTPRYYKTFQLDRVTPWGWPLNITDELKDAMDAARDALPALRIPNEEFLDLFAATGTWVLRGYPSYEREPNPEHAVLAAELADALDAAGYHYLHETPDGWGWTIETDDKGHHAVPTSRYPGTDRPVPATQAWEDNDGGLIVVGTHDPYFAETIWTKYIDSNYPADSDEHRDGLATAEHIARTWHRGYVALPLPDDEQPLDVHDEHAPGRAPVYIGEWSGALPTA